MSKAADYITEHEWLWGVAGAVVLAVLVAIVIGCCVYWLRKRRRGIYYVDLRSSKDSEDSLTYGSMEMKKSLSFTTSSPASLHSSSYGSSRRSSTRTEKGVLEAWNDQRRKKESSEREAALLSCQFYLRNTTSYSLLHPLPDLGSRVAKYWFMVSPATVAPATGQTATSQMVLTLAPVSKYCPIRLQQENLNLLNDLFAALKHPYLYSVQYVDYLPSQKSVVMVTDYFPRGSLKDVIYRRQPLNEWSEKYSLRKRGLSVETVALYGRQVLEGLRVLYRKGFPPLGHLQSGNIFTEGKRCRLSGYEGTLLGYRSRHYRLIKDYPESMDTIMFGHLMFEMICGYELTTLYPSNSDWSNIKNESQEEVLQFIFSVAAQENGSFPTIVEVLDLPFFKSVHLPEPEHLDSSQIHLTNEMKSLLRVVRKGRPAQDSNKTSRRTSPGQPSCYPITKPPHVTRHTSTPSLSPPSLTTPRSNSSDHTALLSSIRKGTRLKGTLTDDRSAPQIYEN